MQHSPTTSLYKFPPEGYPRYDYFKTNVEGFQKRLDTVLGKFYVETGNRKCIHHRLRKLEGTVNVLVVERHGSLLQMPKLVQCLEDKDSVLQKLTVDINKCEAEDLEYSPFFVVYPFFDQLDAQDILILKRLQSNCKTDHVSGLIFVDLRRTRPIQQYNKRRRHKRKQRKTKANKQDTEESTIRGGENQGQGCGKRKRQEHDAYPSPTAVKMPRKIHRGGRLSSESTERVRFTKAELPERGENSHEKDSMGHYKRKRQRSESEDDDPHTTAHTAKSHFSRRTASLKDIQDLLLQQFGNDIPETVLLIDEEEIATTICICLETEAISILALIESCLRRIKSLKYDTSIVTSMKSVISEELLKATNLLLANTTLIEGFGKELSHPGEWLEEAKLEKTHEGMHKGKFKDCIWCGLTFKLYSSISKTSANTMQNAIKYKALASPCLIPPHINSKQVLDMVSEKASFPTSKILTEKIKEIKPKMFQRDENQERRSVKTRSKNYDVPPQKSSRKRKRLRSSDKITLPTLKRRRLDSSEVVTSTKAPPRVKMELLKQESYQDRPALLVQDESVETKLFLKDLSKTRDDLKIDIQQVLMKKGLKTDEQKELKQDAIANVMRSGRQLHVNWCVHLIQQVLGIHRNSFSRMLVDKAMEVFEDIFKEVKRDWKGKVDRLHWEVVGLFSLSEISRPEAVEKESQLIVDDATAQALLKGVPSVRGCGYTFGKLQIHVDKANFDDTGTQIKAKIEDILQSHNITKFEIVPVSKKIQPMALPHGTYGIGEEITPKISSMISDGSKERFGSLGGFATMSVTKDSQCAQPYLCCLVSHHVVYGAKHVSLVRDRDRGDFLEIGKVVDENDKEGIYDISAVEIKEDLVSKFKTMFKNSKGKFMKKCHLYKFPESNEVFQKELQGRKVHIWGAKTNPCKRDKNGKGGRGIVADFAYVVRVTDEKMDTEDDSKLTTDQMSSEASTFMTEPDTSSHDQGTFPYSTPSCTMQEEREPMESTIYSRIEEKKFEGASYCIPSDASQDQQGAAALSANSSETKLLHQPPPERVPSQRIVIIADDDSTDGPFSREGDSGAIIVSDEPDNKGVTVISMLVGHHQDKNGKYVTFRLEEGLDSLKRRTGTPFKIMENG